VEIFSKEHSKEAKLGKMSKETNIKKFFTRPKSPQKSDVNRHVKNSEDSITTLLGCKHSSAIEELTEQFTNNFNLLASEKKKGLKCKVPQKEKILKNGVFLIVLSDEEIKNATSLNEKNVQTKCQSS